MSPRLSAIALCALLAASTASAWQVRIGQLQLKSDGTGSLGEAVVETGFSKDGRFSAAPFGQPNGPAASSGYAACSFQDAVPGSGAKLERKFESLPDGWTLVSVSFQGAGASQGEPALRLFLPAGDFNGLLCEAPGARFKLSPEAKAREFLSGEGGFSAQTPSLLLQAAGAAKVRFTPLDANASSGYALEMTPADAAASSLALRFKLRPYSASPLDISKAMNMGFADETADDGKGGWTDQGPGRDFRHAKPGLELCRGASFALADPAGNGGRSCVVLRGQARPQFPLEASFQAGGRSMKSLCLLHALAWPEDAGVKIGTVKVEYQDGTKGEIPVRSRIDAGEWTSAAQLPNGKPCCLSADGAKGLYMSVFPLEGKPVSKISFASEGKSVWLIAAASAADEELPSPEDLPFAIETSKDWAPLASFSTDVEPGSALDFSWLLDAPAGKYGRVRCDGEDFVFEGSPGKKLRLYGVNMCFWPGKAWSGKSSELLAGRLAASGFNAVRLHAFDNAFTVKGQPSYVLDPAALEAFDDFFEALKAKGIYLTLDLYVHRSFRKGELPEMAGGAKDLDSLKCLIPISDAALENWKAFSKGLLTHVNVRSGLAWKDDPALVSVSLVNENTVFFMKRNIERNADLMALYDAKFEAWLAERKASPPSKKERDALLSDFYLETFSAAYLKMSSFVRELGVRQPLTEQNNGNETGLAPYRAKYDYADNHFYFDFPKFLGSEWKPPMGIENVSAAARLNGAQADCFPTRLFGKPFAITEYNWVYPNAQRGELGAMAPAYAALQGWSAMILYQYSAGVERDFLSGGPSTRWELAKDPLETLSLRMGSLLYLRSDVEASSLKIPVAVDESCLGAQANWRYPKLLRNLGLVGAVGSVAPENGKLALPAGAKALVSLNASQSYSFPNVKNVCMVKGDEASRLAELEKACGFGKGFLDLARQRARSSTGELEIDALAKTFSAATPRSEALVVPGEGAFGASAMNVENKGGFAVFFVAALDGKELRNSSRMLILHLTDVVNSGLKFRSKEMKVVEDMGKLPFLARRSSALMALSLGKGAAQGSWTLYGLDFSGKRLESRAASPSAEGGFKLQLDGYATKEPRMAYELVREPAGSPGR